MYRNDVKKILKKELNAPLTVAGILIICNRNNCNISRDRLFNLLLELTCEGFLLRETTRNVHPKRKPIYLFTLSLPCVIRGAKSEMTNFKKNK